MPNILTRSCNALGIPTKRESVFPSTGSWRQHLLSWLPFFLSACWLFFAVYWDSVLQVVSQKRFNVGEPPMPDVGHYYLPWIIVTNSSGVQNVHNIYAIVFGAVTAFRFVWTGRLFFVILRRFFAIWGWMFILRGACIALTNYPYTDGTYYPLCQPSLQYGSTTLAQGWWVMFGYNATCNDFMFSGHTVIFTLLALQWSTYSKNEFAWMINLNNKPKWVRRLLRPKLSATGDADGCWLIPFLAWCTMAGGVIVLIGGRIHYSFDCVVGWLMCFTYYKLYFYYLKTVYERKTLVSQFMIWFEGLSLPTNQPPPANEGQVLTTSDLYVYQPSAKQRMVYPYVQPLKSIEGLPQNDAELSEYNSGKSELNANRPPIVLITIPNELNASRPLQYLYTADRRRDVAVAASGAPMNWGVLAEEQ